MRSEIINKKPLHLVGTTTILAIDHIYVKKIVRIPFIFWLLGATFYYFLKLIFHKKIF
jgi:hypothetical protein